MGDPLYDISYYDGMLRNYSGSAENICKIRWEWVAECNARNVLDFGCGIGWFRAFAPSYSQVDTFDVMPVPQTGVTREVYDLLTMWDVLEHLPNMDAVEPFLDKCRYVAISIPIMPADTAWMTWKHFKPHEHLFYPTREQIMALFEMYDFELIKEGQPECPPRLDIWNFLFEKV